MKGDGYFIEDVIEAINDSIYFDLELLTDQNIDKWKSNHLMYSTSNATVISEPLLASRSNKLDNNLILELKAQQYENFLNEKFSLADVNEPGDYYIDYVNGVIFTEALASGYVSYTYRKFPFTLYWQPVRAFPLNDPDIKYTHYDTLLSDDTGLPEYTLLNSHGAKIANKTLQVHPLGWGK